MQEHESPVAAGLPRRSVSTINLRVATACVTLVLCLAAAEAFVRLSGRRPWSEGPIHRNEPTMLRPDPLLGWRTKPGEYRYPGYGPDASIRMTIWPDGSRATRPRADERPRRMVLSGDSFTQGWAVSDDETWAWMIQARWPAFDVRNYGTAGYSTYQSLLLLEERLDRDAPPEVVVHVLSEYHEVRNVAEAGWLRALASNKRAGVPITMPFCTLGPDGALETHPAEAYPVWPPGRTSAAVTALADTWARIHIGDRGTQGRAVTEALLRRLHVATARHRATLLVVLLGSRPEAIDAYGRTLDALGVPWVDCNVPTVARLLVPGEGHPNAVWHGLFADCVDAALRSRVQ